MLTKAKLSNVDDSGKPGSNSFHVQFNPNEIAISEAVASLYDMEKGTGDPHVNPVETKKDKQVLHLSTTLFYNTLPLFHKKAMRMYAPISVSCIPIQMSVWRRKKT